MKQLKLAILSILFIAFVLVILPGASVSAEKELSSEEIKQFLQEAFDAQLLLNRKSRTIAEVMEELSPYFNEDYSKMFIEARLFKDIDGWYLPGSDDFYALVPRFSFDGSTKIKRIANTILITEFVEANTDGPWTWDAHEESVELQLTKDGWRIRNINGILDLTPMINIEVRGEALTLSQVPIQQNNRVLVPLRGVFERMGASVKWVGAKQMVEIIKGKDRIELTIGEKVATVGDKSIALDTAPTIVNGHTMLPIRFVGETLGMKVKWDSGSQTVFID